MLLPSFFPIMVAIRSAHYTNHGSAKQNTEDHAKLKDVRMLKKSPESLLSSERLYVHSYSTLSIENRALPRDSRN